MRGRGEELVDAAGGEAFGGYVETDTGRLCGVANATGRARSTAKAANTTPSSTKSTPPRRAAG